MKFAICIPSYQRAERLLYSQGQITLAYVATTLLDKTYLFVRESEEESYLPVAEKYGVGLITVPDDVNGIKGTRDCILDWAKEQELEKCIMIDDDIRLDWKPDARTYKRMIGGEYFDRMIADLLDVCRPDYPVVGITARQFSNNKTEYADFDTRIIQVFCLHMPTILKAGIRFSQFAAPFMSDYYFVLSMLQTGYHNICLNHYCRDDNTQTPGGCSSVRTVENASKSAVTLSKAFPGIVTPYVKTTGTWSENRVNVRISWKKAFRKKT